MKKLTVAELINVSGAGDSEVEISFQGSNSFADIFPADISFGTSALPTDISLGTLTSVDFAKLCEGVEVVELESA